MNQIYEHGDYYLATPDPRSGEFNALSCRQHRTEQKQRTQTPSPHTPRVNSNLKAEPKNPATHNLPSIFSAPIFEIKLTSKYKPLVCALNDYNLNSREKFEPGPGGLRFKSRSRYEFFS